MFTSPHDSISISLVFIIRCINSYSIEGFVADISLLLIKYGLNQVFTNFVSTGMFPSKIIWKKLVNNCVANKNMNDMRQQISVDSVLLTYTKLYDLDNHSNLWKLGRCYPKYLKFCRTGIRIIGTLCNRNAPNISMQCRRCLMMCTEHSIFYCESNAELRYKFWIKLSMLHGNTWLNEFNKLAVKDQLCTMLVATKSYSIHTKPSYGFSIYPLFFCINLSHHVNLINYWINYTTVS